MAATQRPEPVPVPLPIGVAPATLTAAEFRRVAAIARNVAGIDLKEGKEALVAGRLSQRLRVLRVATVRAYLDLVESPAGRGEMPHLIDVLTTNKTNFFREPAHFDYLQRHILPQVARSAAPFRVWSAAASSGEEPYTIAMIAREYFGAEAARRVRIHGTDISRRILARAAAAVYRDETVADVPQPYRAKHLERVSDSPAGSWRIVTATRAMVEFAYTNLMEEWTVPGPFDLILCRNVMIYFDRATQERLVNRLARMLAPGGHLFVGHAESLSNIKHPLRYVQPAVYQNAGGITR